MGTVLAFPAQKKTRRSRAAKSRPAGRDLDAELRNPELREIGDALDRSIREAASRMRARRNACIDRWRAGSRTAAATFYKQSICGLGTNTYGEGGDVYRAGRDSVIPADVLHSSQKDEALALAIEQLNAFGVLARFGGMSVHVSDCGDPAGDYAAHTLADLGATLARLREFGAMVQPSPLEREHIARARAEYLGDGLP